MNRRISVAAIVVTTMLTGGISVAGATEIMVYKSASCGCCKNWVEHLRANGFTVKTQDVTDIRPYKNRYGITPALASCHTAVVDGYAIEGHVPAADIKRLLKERPAIRGLAAPGMPSGSPGMEQGRVDAYDVLSYDMAGKSAIYASH